MRKEMFNMASAWVNQMFRADAVQTGGVIRRAVHTVERFSSREDLRREVSRRGFHMVISGEQYLILCNKGTFKVIC
jgi:hypothetical protein